MKTTRRGVDGYRGAVARRLLVAVLAGCVIALVVGPAAQAATLIYVDEQSSNCSNSGPGTQATPLCTISAAAGRAVAGDTVIVASGDYTEQVTVAASGTATAPITFTVAQGADVTVRGGAYGFRVSSKSWITIKGFHVVDTVDHGISVTGSSNVIIEANEVSGAGTGVSGQTARGISLTTTTNSRVEGNDTHDNSDTGIFLGYATSTGNSVTNNSSSANARLYTRAAAGFDIRSPGTTVSGNVSFDNEDSGINIWDSADGSLVFNNVVYDNGDHGIDNKSSDNTQVVANTVFGGVDSGIEVVSSTGVELANNISADNGIDSPRTSGNLRVDSFSTQTIVLDYDLVFLSVPGVMVDWAGQEYSSLAAFVAATGKESHGLEADPRFKAPASGDFHLLAGAPAIDSANSGVVGHPSVDADGKARNDDPDTANSGVGPRTFDDRGAFEFLAPK